MPNVTVIDFDQHKVHVEGFHCIPHECDKYNVVSEHITHSTSSPGHVITQILDNQQENREDGESHTQVQEDCGRTAFSGLPVMEISKTFIFALGVKVVKYWGKRSKTAEY